jgi:hypothetical protein
MSTRSFIAVQKEDGSIIDTYCHWDGYIQHNGRILQKFFSDYDKALSLVEGGSISHLNDDGTYEYDPYLAGPKEYINIEEYKKSLGGLLYAFHYYFLPFGENEWKHSFEGEEFCSFINKLKEDESICLKQPF